VIFMPSGFVRTMGGSQCSKSEPPPSVEMETTKIHNIRASMRSKIPMPDRNELERKFTRVLVSEELIFYGKIGHP